MPSPRRRQARRGGRLRCRRPRGRRRQVGAARDRARRDPAEERARARRGPSSTLAPARGALGVRRDRSAGRSPRSRASKTASAAPAGGASAAAQATISKRAVLVRAGTATTTRRRTLTTPGTDARARAATPCARFVEMWRTQRHTGFLLPPATCALGRPFGRRGRGVSDARDLDPRDAAQQAPSGRAPAVRDRARRASCTNGSAGAPPAPLPGCFLPSYLGERAAERRGGARARSCHRIEALGPRGATRPIRAVGLARCGCAILLSLCRDARRRARNMMGGGWRGCRGRYAGAAVRADCEITRCTTAGTRVDAPRLVAVGFRARRPLCGARRSRRRSRRYVVLAKRAMAGGTSAGVDAATTAAAKALSDMSARRDDRHRPTADKAPLQMPAARCSCR